MGNTRVRRLEIGRNGECLKRLEVEGSLQGYAWVLPGRGRRSTKGRLEPLRVKGPALG